jgi:hypothetical protein
MAPIVIVALGTLLLFSSVVLPFVTHATAQVTAALGGDAQ